MSNKRKRTTTTTTVPSDDEDADATELIDDEDSATEELPSAVASAVSVELTTPSFGLGTLALGVVYPDRALRPSRAAAIQMIHALVDAGVRFFDTADTYCEDSSDLHYVEQVIADALNSYAKGVPADLIVATKGGMVRTRNGESSSSWFPGSNTRENVHRQIKASFEALGRRPIDLWQIHHVNAAKDSLISATLTAVRAAHEMVRSGLVRRVGICNATVAQLEALARERLPIASVQNEFSLFQQEAALPRKSAAHTTSKRGVLLYCMAQRIPFIAYAPLGGLKARRAERSLTEFAPLVDAARRLGASVHAVALAHMAARFSPMITIAGARTTAHALDSTAGAAAVFKRLGELSPAQRAALDGLWREK
jgi:aryl-alcohol dehydrogenase-like predicted oxidoreductase